MTTYDIQMDLDMYINTHSSASSLIIFLKCRAKYEHHLVQWQFLHGYSWEQFSRDNNWEIISGIRSTKEQIIYNYNQ
jgi:hypothetical protein